MGGKRGEDAGLYRDWYAEPFYVFRENDPIAYGFICPHCCKRYGKPKPYIDVERCQDCPAYYPGMEISWNINKATREKLKELGYFKGPPRGGRKKAVSIQTE
jgi:hypothetical protein